jgi:hypothetical protein
MTCVGIIFDMGKPWGSHDSPWYTMVDPKRCTILQWLRSHPMMVPWSHGPARQMNASPRSLAGDFDPHKWLKYHRNNGEMKRYNGINHILLYIIIYIII